MKIPEAERKEGKKDGKVEEKQAAIFSCMGGKPNGNELRRIYGVYIKPSNEAVKR